MGKIPITLQIQDPEGNVVKEKNITISTDDTLIFRFTDFHVYNNFIRMDPERRQEMFGTFKKAIDEGGGTLVLPPFCELQVLHKRIEVEVAVSPEDWKSDKK